MGLGLHDVAVLLLMLLVPLASKGLGRVAMGCTGRQHDGSSRENVRPHVEAVSSSRSACANKATRRVACAQLAKKRKQLGGHSCRKPADCVLPAGQRGAPEGSSVLQRPRRRRPWQMEEQHRWCAGVEIRRNTMPAAMNSVQGQKQG